MSEEYRLRLQIRQLETGAYLATSDDLPGLVAQGKTVVEAVEISQDVARKLIESCREHGDPLPKGRRRVDRSRGGVMGRLAGFTYRQVTRKLRRLEFTFDRQARGSHEIWWNPDTRHRTTIPDHPGDLPEGTLAAILATSRHHRGKISCSVRIPCTDFEPEVFAKRSCDVEAWAKQSRYGLPQQRHARPSDCRLATYGSAGALAGAPGRTLPRASVSLPYVSADNTNRPGAPSKRAKWS